MLSKEFLEHAAFYLSDERKEVLKESYGSINKGVTDLYKAGVEIQLDERKISSSALQRLYQKIQNNYQLDEFEDYEITDFLVCFELGFNHTIAAILPHRKKLKLICGGLLYAAHRFARTPRSYKEIRHPTVSEEFIFEELQKAQDARWAGYFNKCYQIIHSLENSIFSSHLSEKVRQYWTASINDLKVEASFTIGNLAYSTETLKQSEETIDDWEAQRDYIKLTHAYLRKAVLHRQLSSAENDLKVSFFESVDTLLGAEKEVGYHLIAQKNNQDAVNTLISLYCDIAKNYAQIKNFSLAWQYYHRALNKLEQLDSLRSRRRMDVIRAKAIILSEQYKPRRLYEINQIEQGIEDMYFAIEHTKQFHSNDFMLQELLAKDLIPLLAIVGNAGKLQYKEDAQILLLRCQKKAVELNLHYQQRGLEDMTRRFLH